MTDTTETATEADPHDPAGDRVVPLDAWMDGLTEYVLDTWDPETTDERAIAWVSAQEKDRHLRHLVLVNADLRTYGRWNPRRVLTLTARPHLDGQALVWPYLTWDLLAAELRLLSDTGEAGHPVELLVIHPDPERAHHVCERLDIAALAVHADGMGQLVARRDPERASAGFLHCYTPREHDYEQDIDWFHALAEDDRDGEVLDATHCVLDHWRTLDPAMDTALLERLDTRARQAGDLRANAVVQIEILLHRLAHHWRLAATHADFQAVLRALTMACDRVCYVMQEDRGGDPVFAPAPTPGMPWARLADRDAVYHALQAIEQSYTGMNTKEPEHQDAWPEHWDAWEALQEKFGEVYRLLPQGQIAGPTG
ncbi:hypothetical protein [Kitasatospora sp. HPMI-4]|uniref:hypothetical protein n=1 Tax=Kitasatospora sp. HPMI-4 TaxID=3448443 RepID=UPI003F19D0AC